jgi:hypothetical protein
MARARRCRDGDVGAVRAHLRASDGQLLVSPAYTAASAYSVRVCGARAPAWCVAHHVCAGDDTGAPNAIAVFAYRGIPFYVHTPPPAPLSPAGVTSRCDERGMAMCGDVRARVRACVRGCSAA